mgnify:CR=1 FL=1
MENLWSKIYRLPMLTKKRNLRTGRPVWLAHRQESIPASELTTDKKTEVVIIGAGISGAMVAEELSSLGFKIIMLDERGPLKGSTVASTALLQYEIDEPLSLLSKKIGNEKAVRAWRRSKLGVDNLAAKIESLNIDCDYTTRHALYLAGNKLNAAELKKEWQARNHAGLYSEYLNAQALKEKHGIDRAAALKSFGNISADPMKLAGALLMKTINNGGQIFAPCKATSIEHSGGLVHIKTKSGPVVSAKHVIFATGYQIPKYIDHKAYKITSTWAIATRPQKRQLWPEECFVWEASDPYLYLRTTIDGRIVCGGEDEEFADAEERDAKIPAKTRKLEQKLKKLFPGIDTKAEYSWAGCFGVSPTSLPKIGKLPGHKNCYAIMGLGGNGITFSRIGAELIRAELTGNPDPDADLFRID